MSARRPTEREARQIRPPGAQLNPPAHLSAEVLSYLAARAEARGASLNDLVNESLRNDLELIEAARQLLLR